MPPTKLGHTFGLVNRTRLAFEEDPDHRGHTDDEYSVMYWAAESPLGGIFRTGPPSDFNGADRREMQRIREQRP